MDFFWGGGGGNEGVQGFSLLVGQCSRFWSFCKKARGGGGWVGFGWKGGGKGGKGKGEGGRGGGVGLVLMLWREVGKGWWVVGQYAKVWGNIMFVRVREV